MKQHASVCVPYILALVLAFVPAVAQAAGAVTPTGSGDALYSNGTALLVDTKENLPGAATAVRASIAGFMEGTDDPDATVAYWTITGADATTTTYYIPIKAETVLYAGGDSGDVENARVTMKGGRVGGLVAGGTAGTVTNASVSMTGGTASSVTVGGGGLLNGEADLSISGGTPGDVALGAGLGNAAVSLHADGQTVSLSGDISVKSLSIKADTTLEVPSGSGNSLTALETLDVSGTLTNNGSVTANQVNASGTGIISNNSGAAIAAAVQIGSGAALTNKGAVAGDLINQGTVNLDNGTVSGDMQSSGAIVGTKTLSVAAGQSLTIAGGTVAPSLANNGSVRIQGGTLEGAITNAGELAISGGMVNGKVINESGKIMAVTGGTLAMVDNSGALEVSTAGRIMGGVSNDAGGMLNLKAGGGISGPVTNAGGLTITGGEVGGTLSNSGTLNVSGGTVNGAVTNGKTMNVSGGTISGKVINAGTGTVAVSAGGALSLSGDIDNEKGGSISGEGLTVAAGRTMTNQGTLNADTITENGTLINDAGGSVAQDAQLINTATGVITNAGTIASALENRSGGRVVNTGLISGTPLTNAGALTNQNKGQISSTQINNSGTLTNDDGSSITSAATLANTGALTNNGTIAAKLDNKQNGTVTNNKTITGVVTNASGGSITNGENGTISGSLANESGGTISNGGTISGEVSNSGTIKNTNKTASVSGKVTGNAVQNFDSTITAINADGTITLAGMPEGSVLTTTNLSTSSASYKALAEAANGGKIISAYEITCNKPLAEEKTLTFKLGSEYAKKKITGLHYVNGIVSKHTAKADSNGDFSMPVTSLSPFMLVEGSGASSTKAPVKTGTQTNSTAGFGLLFLGGAVLAIRRKYLAKNPPISKKCRK
ncbi:MAG: hypothetical protein VB049_01060 [Candidatus Pelethousia sp.]|nr:hypothetical protein [Candidatus Pelethousia sp.]